MTSRIPDYLYTTDSDGNRHIVESVVMCCTNSDCETGTFVHPIEEILEMFYEDMRGNEYVHTMCACCGTESDLKNWIVPRID